MSKIETFFNIIKNAQKATDLVVNDRDEILKGLEATTKPMFISRFNLSYHRAFMDALFAERITMSMINENFGSWIARYQVDLGRHIMTSTTPGGFGEMLTTAYSHYIWCSRNASRNSKSSTFYASSLVAFIFLEFLSVNLLVEATGNEELRELASKHGYTPSSWSDEGFISVAEHFIREEREQIQANHKHTHPNELKERLSTTVHCADYHALVKLDELSVLLLA